MSIRSVFNPITSSPSVKEQVPTSLNSTANKKGRCPKILGLFRMYLNGGSSFLLTRFDGKNLPEGLERGKLVPAHEYRPQSTVWCNCLTKRGTATHLLIRSGSLKLVKKNKRLLSALCQFISKRLKSQPFSEGCKHMQFFFFFFLVHWRLFHRSSG